MKTPRSAAALAVAAVIGKGDTLGDALNASLGNLSGRDRAMAREMAFGVCRRYFELDGMLRQLLEKPLKQKDADLHALLLIGMYQLRHMRVPDHAAVAETVAAARQLHKSWAAGLVNAVLRNFLAREQELVVALTEAQRLAHPQWLLRCIDAQWLEHRKQIIEANNTPPEMSLRVNRGRLTRQEWIALANGAGIEATAGELSGDAVQLRQAVDVERIPGFAEGLVSVQDQAAQLAAPLLRCEPKQRVLDACAAPGGKTGHLLELYPDLRVTALDNHDRRLLRVQENLQRLEFAAELICGDATRPDAWWNGNYFDRILLDAPCSATGVIRRHPDIKVLRTLDQVAKAHGVQLQLLSAVWNCLATGGLLLYCTCSILPVENEMVIAEFLQRTPQALHESLNVNWGIQREYGRQLLPRESNHDGFYYALLRKTA